MAIRFPKHTAAEWKKALLGKDAGPPELRGLPRFHGADEDPYPLAGPHCRGGYSHRFQTQGNGKDQCLLPGCGLWRDESLPTAAELHERMQNILHPQVPAESPRVHHKGGWAGHAVGSMVRNALGR
jgi:hypothetical protein